MERTSSLDLFRGSADASVFSDLNFLDGQESFFEASVSQAPSASLPSSNAVPASLPSSSASLANGQNPATKLLHSNRMSGWPAATSSAYISSAQPVSMHHEYLYGSSQRPASAADSQTDSFAALLADDTALGFADDCFRRESDLFVSQDRSAVFDALPAQPAAPSDSQSQAEVQSQTDKPHEAAQRPLHAVTADTSMGTQRNHDVSAASEAQHPLEQLKPSQAAQVAEPAAQSEPAAFQSNAGLQPDAQDISSVIASAPQSPSDKGVQRQLANTALQQQQQRPKSGQSAVLTSEPRQSQASLQASDVPSSLKDDGPKAAVATESTDSVPAQLKAVPVPDIIPESNGSPSSADQHTATSSSPSKPASAEASLSKHTQAPITSPLLMLKTQESQPQGLPLKDPGMLPSASTVGSALAAPHNEPEKAGSADDTPQSSSEQAVSITAHTGTSDPAAQQCQSAKAGHKEGHQSAVSVTKPEPASDDRAKLPVAPPAQACQVTTVNGVPNTLGIRHWGHHFTQAFKVATASLPGRCSQTSLPSVKSPPQEAALPVAAAQLASRTGRPPSSSCPALSKVPQLASTSHPVIPQIASRARQSSVAKPVPAAVASKTQADAMATSPSAQGGAVASSAHLVASTQGSLPPSQLARLASPRANARQSTAARPIHQGETSGRPQQPSKQAVKPAKSNGPDTGSTQLPAALAQQQGRQAAAKTKQAKQSASSPLLQSQSSPQSRRQSPAVPAQQPQDMSVSALQACYRLPSAPEVVSTSSLKAALPTSSSTALTCSATVNASQQAASSQLQAAGTLHAQQLVTSPTAAVQANAAPPQPDADDAQQQNAHLPHPQTDAEAPHLISPITAKHAAQQLDETQPSGLVTALQPINPSQQPLKTTADQTPPTDATQLQPTSNGTAQQALMHDQELLEQSVRQTGLSLAAQVEAASSAVPSMLAECLASNRIKRVPGGDPLEAAPFRRFVEMVRSNSHDFEAQGRVLRLKQYISADVRPAAINAILEALAVNTLVEVLYIQNFEHGMFDEQLIRLTEVLKKGRIWALNAGENFEISLQAWETFTKELQHTAVAYMYVSEHHLARTDLKRRMQDAIRDNRRQAPRRDAEVIKCVGNMWWNPKLPSDSKLATSRPAGGESALASLARDMVASQAGSRQSGSSSQSRKRKVQPQDTAVSSHSDKPTPSSGKAGHRGAKRPRAAVTADSSPQTAGQEQAADSKYSLSSAEKRDMRTKRREQRHSIDAIPARHAQARNSGLSSPAVTVSSPMASQGRTPASAPAGGAGSLRTRAPSARSRLAAQSGLSVNAADDSDESDDQAVAAVPMRHADAEQKAVLAGHKRKRQQQHKSGVKTASPARATQSAAAQQQSEQDAKTEQSRSSDAATPSEMNAQRAQAQSHAVRRVAQHAQHAQHADRDSVNEPASDSLPSVRRTGRQRKLTAAAAAAIEDFPSLYQQPARPPAPAHRGKVSNPNGNSASSDEQADWQGRSSAAAKTSKRSQSKQAQAQETASNGVNTVQLSQLVRYGILPAGRHEFVFRQRHACEVEVLPDGDILYQGDLYDTLAKFGRAVSEDTSSGRQTCNCWRDITWQGQKLESLRQAAHNKSQQAKRPHRK